ncbi:MAG: hypothetical protein CMB64_05205 [Euryarchaeota archaeon]|nr:hypothetical protein [Euryarchaeota archaeon]|tara:strand:+ start:238 stop:759 length:522 start_codon:yes stop_codon:yes gene_type:complete
MIALEPLCVEMLMRVFQLQNESRGVTFPKYFRLDEDVMRLWLTDYYRGITKEIEEEKIIDNCCAQIIFGIRDKKHVIKKYHLHAILATSLSFCLKFYTTRQMNENLCTRLLMNKKNLRKTEIYMLQLFRFDLPIHKPKIQKSLAWYDFILRKQSEEEFMTEEQHAAMLYQLLR